ncbi:hypothetical protein LAZ67_17001363 [Cordylochernes scorpioides]|uniref:Uncharacterized protein n=1 Tax=Cordylochernes scorpioides TaxID=51811 RepID=A0ABY6LFG5_9ARAC|nr:hypothetical protein LAZ67_17001363 [Cordylochernes scorpioides]
MSLLIKIIDMNPEQQTLHTKDREHCDCFDRDAWRYLRLFIGHDDNKNSRKLTWTQHSSFANPR